MGAGEASCGEEHQGIMVFPLFDGRAGLLFEKGGGRFRVMHRALDLAYTELVESGTQANLIDQMRTRAELYATLDYPNYGQPTW